MDTAPDKASDDKTKKNEETAAVKEEELVSHGDPHYFH